TAAEVASSDTRRRLASDHLPGRWLGPAVTGSGVRAVGDRDCWVLEWRALFSCQPGVAGGVPQNRGGRDGEELFFVQKQISGSSSRASRGPGRQTRNILWSSASS